MMQDFRSVDLAVGDTIVYAFVSGNTPYLRIGTILEFVEKKRSYSDKWITKMKVEWKDTESIYVSPGQWEKKEKLWTSLVEFSDRALKI